MDDVYYGKGKGGKGLGKGGAKRHRKVLRDNIQGITKPAIRRLARRGGVKRLSGLIYEETRGVLKVYLENVIRDAVTYTEHARRKTVTAMDVVSALKRQGKTLYGFGSMEHSGTSSVPKKRKQKRQDAQTVQYEEGDTQLLESETQPLQQEELGSFQLIGPLPCSDKDNRTNIKNYFKFNSSGKSSLCGGIIDKQWVDENIRDQDEFFAAIDENGNYSAILLFHRMTKPLSKDLVIGKDYEFAGKGFIPSKVRMDQITQPQNFKPDQVVAELALICNDSSERGVGSKLYNMFLDEIRVWKESLEVSKRNQEQIYVFAGQALVDYDPKTKEEIREKSKQVDITNRNPFYKSWIGMKGMKKKGEEYDLYAYSKGGVFEKAQLYPLTRR